MATINEELAKQLANSNGVFTDEDGFSDPQAFAVFKYYNHQFDKDDYAVAYSLNDFMRYVTVFQIKEILYAKDKMFVTEIVGIN